MDLARRLLVGPRHSNPPTAGQPISRPSALPRHLMHEGAETPQWYRSRSTSDLLSYPAASPEHFVVASQSRVTPANMRNEFYRISRRRIVGAAMLSAEKDRRAETTSRRHVSYYAPSDEGAYDAASSSDRSKTRRRKPAPVAVAATVGRVAGSRHNNYGGEENDEDEESEDEQTGANYRSPLDSCTCDFASGRALALHPQHRLHAHQHQHQHQHQHRLLRPQAWPRSASHCCLVAEADLEAEAEAAASEDRRVSEQRLLRIASYHHLPRLVPVNRSSGTAPNPPYFFTKQSHASRPSTNYSTNYPTKPAQQPKHYKSNPSLSFSQRSTTDHCTQTEPSEAEDNSVEVDPRPPRRTSRPTPANKRARNRTVSVPLHELFAVARNKMDKEIDKDGANADDSGNSSGTGEGDSGVSDVRKKRTAALAASTDSLDVTDEDLDQDLDVEDDDDDVEDNDEKETEEAVSIRVQKESTVHAYIASRGQREREEEIYEVLPVTISMLKAARGSNNSNVAFNNSNKMYRKRIN